MPHAVPLGGGNSGPATAASSLPLHAARQETEHPCRFAGATLAEGGGHACEVVDISLAGAAVKASIQPPAGLFLMRGRPRPRVVRHSPGGFAVDLLSSAAGPQADNPLA